MIRVVVFAVAVNDDDDDDDNADNIKVMDEGFLESLQAQVNRKFKY